MKKIFLFVAVLAGMTVFTSCENMFNNIIDKITGNASSIIGSGDTAVEQEYTASIIMFEKNADPQYAVGLSMVMDIEELLNIDELEDLQYPFLVYRVVGNKIKKGSTFTVNNTLTEEDLKDFDYESLISGQFSENNLVGIAVNTHEFYIMNTGTISLSKVTSSKVVGSFTGSAYKIDLDNEHQMISPELVPMSGNFTSRVTNLLKWLMDLQTKKK